MLEQGKEKFPILSEIILSTGVKEHIRPQETAYNIEEGDLYPNPWEEYYRDVGFTDISFCLKFF